MCSALYIHFRYTYISAHQYLRGEIKEENWDILEPQWARARHWKDDQIKYKVTVHAHFLTNNLNGPPMKYLGSIDYLINQPNKPSPFKYPK